MGSTSNKVTIAPPNAEQRSPIRPALAALCSESWATTVMNWTMYATWGCTMASSGAGADPSPFRPWMMPVYASRHPSLSSLR